jgi:hypothetical protein
MPNFFEGYHNSAFDSLTCIHLHYHSYFNFLLLFSFVYSLIEFTSVDFHPHTLPNGIACVAHTIIMHLETTRSRSRQV